MNILFRVAAAPLLFVCAAFGAETDVAAELKRLTTLISAQQASIEALRAAVAEQQVRIDRLQAAANSKPLAPVQAPPPAPALTAAALAPTAAPAAKETPKHWFEKFALRGYTQFRYNRLLETNGQLTCDQCDRSIGNNNAFFFRRARFILSGDINDRVAIYFQPDFASQSGGLNFGQVRDLYFDLALDKKKEFRIRAGQSKAPFSFENLQSSQNRLALDRADATNSAHPNEREAGLFLYYAPARIRSRFAELVSSGLKGSGDYGVLAVGAFNGQGMGRPEANNNLHRIVRLSYPFQLKNGRFIEPGLAAYTGEYTVTSDQRTAGVRGPGNFADRRVLGSLAVYPQPLGFQAEFNVGTGPRYENRTNAIRSAPLRGGYAQVMYQRKVGPQTFTPFVKYQYFSGGKKFEQDARSYLVRDIDFGLEWQKNRFLEIVGQYSRSDRTYEDGRLPSNRQKGGLLRLQLQVNY